MNETVKDFLTIAWVALAIAAGLVLGFFVTGQSLKAFVDSLIQ